MKAYFTVEAACVLPIVFGTFVFIIYSMFYQYDRCLLEQDVAVFVMETLWEAQGDDERKPLLHEDKEGYLAFRLEDSVLEAKNSVVSVRAEGKVPAPFGDWQVTAIFAAKKIEPAEWIRACNKIMEEVENATD